MSNWRGGAVAGSAPRARHVHLDPNKAPLGFFVAGSSIDNLNGVYERAAPGENDITAFDTGLNLLYRHDSSGWMLVHLGSEDEAGEWIFVDDLFRDRFGQPGKAHPTGGRSWSHLKRSPRIQGPVNCQRIDRLDQENNDDGCHSAAVIKSDDESNRDDEHELPWQVEPIPIAAYFEQVLVGDRKARAARAWAKTARMFPPSAAATSTEEHPPQDMDRVPVTAASSESEGWAAALVHLQKGRLARRQRLFNETNHALQAALLLFPRFKAAHEERGKMLLDAGRPDEALAQFTLLFALEHGDVVLGWLVRATAASKRAAAARAPRPPSPDDPGCEAVTVGSNIGTHKSVYVSSSDVRCPRIVNKNNWLGEDKYDNWFEVTQEGTEVTVKRGAEFEVAMTHGWGMNLQFVCCVPTRTASPEGDAELETMVKRPTGRDQFSDYFAILKVPCDATPDEIKTAYRALALELHPDRAGSDDQREFTQVARAYECLRDTMGCREKYEKGANLHLVRGGGECSTEEEVDRKYFPQRYPHHPYGDPYARGGPGP